MGKLIEPEWNTTVDIPPDRVLESAVGKLTEVIVLGYETDGSHYFAASTSKSDRLYWLAAKFQAMLLRLAREDELNRSAPTEDNQR